MRGGDFVGRRNGAQSQQTGGVNEGEAYVSGAQ